MKKYDYKKAQRLIKENKERIRKASLGMQEDWMWTAVTVFEDGEFIEKLKSEPAIAGIKGSYWATPTLELVFKNGKKKHVACFLGESDRESPAFMGGWNF